MLLTSACGDAVLLRCLSWQVDAMLAVTVRVAVTWPGRDGLSPAVARLGGVAASTCTGQISSPRHGEEICPVQVLAATPSCCTCLPLMSGVRVAAARCKPLMRGKRSKLRLAVTLASCHATAMGACP